LEEKQKDLARLQLRAEVAGTILPLPAKKDAPAAPDQLPGWSGTPFDPENRHAYFQRGDEFCQVVPDPTKYEAMLFVDQADLRHVHTGQPVRIRLDAYPGFTFRGTIDQVSDEPLIATPETATTSQGGQVATRTDPTGTQRPLSAIYPAKVLLDDPDQLLSPGLRGRAKIKSDWRSAGSRVWQWLTRTFHFEL
jgi:hypothetical protein